MGYIYIIKNSINNKVYIGQTVHSVQKRWNAHKYMVGRSDDDLYKDMYNMGIDKFSIEILEECADTILNDRERFFIRKYNAYYNGYNNTLGGGAVTKYDSIITNILNDIHFISIRDICKKYNVSEGFIKTLRQDIGADSNVTISYSNDSKQLVMYDTKFENPILFNSIKLAVEYLKVDRCNFSRNLDRACEYGTTHYGHKWQWANDLIAGDKVFKTKFEKEAYLGGMDAYQPNGKKYWVVDGVLNGYITRAQNIRNVHITAKSIVYCKVCGKKIYSRSKSGLCISCSQVKAKGKPVKPSKCQLIQDLSNYTIRGIADKYDRSESTIYYWIRDYGIEYYRVRGKHSE